MIELEKLPFYKDAHLSAEHTANIDKLIKGYFELSRIKKFFFPKTLFDALFNFQASTGNKIKEAWKVGQVFTQELSLWQKLLFSCFRQFSITPLIKDMEMSLLMNDTMEKPLHFIKTTDPNFKKKYKQYEDQYWSEVFFKKKFPQPYHPILFT